VSGHHVTRGFTEYGRLEHVVLKHARDAFDPAIIEEQWRPLNYAAAQSDGVQECDATKVK